ncbi:MAG TPA: PhnD/SsuA/transferrin family substrate-binding protein [bacterium]|nr:PhnD/SsuA/transferrin family substrate-binding protein [bacterium]
MRRAFTFITVIVLAAACAATLSCRRSKDVSEMEPNVVLLGPTFDPARAPKQFEPLAAYLQEKVGQPFEFRPTKSREEFSTLVKDGKAAFVFANPLDYFEVADACIVLVKPNYPGKGSMVQGSIIVREGEAVKIREVTELKGSSIMIVSESSLDGYLSQKMFFDRSGLDLDLDFDLRESPDGRPENVIAAVAAGEVEYGCVPAEFFPGRKPVKGAEVLTYSEKVPVEVFAFVEMGGDKMLGGKVRDVLKAIPKDDPVLKLLGIDSFILAAPAEYGMVINFLTQDKIEKAQRLSEAPAKAGTS